MCSDFRVRPSSIHVLVGVLGFAAAAVPSAHQGNYRARAEIISPWYSARPHRIDTREPQFAPASIMFATHVPHTGGGVCDLYCARGGMHRSSVKKRIISPCAKHMLPSGRGKTRSGGNVRRVGKMRRMDNRRRIVNYHAAGRQPRATISATVATSASTAATAARMRQTDSGLSPATLPVCPLTKKRYTRFR